MSTQFFIAAIARVVVLKRDSHPAEGFQHTSSLGCCADSRLSRVIESNLPVAEVFRIGVAVSKIVVDQDCRLAG
jgi:hypothetical protein